MDDETTREWWRNKVEGGYFTAFSFAHSYPNMARFNLKDKKILELGFGYGRELSQFCKVSKTVWGLDIATAAPGLALSKLKEYGVENLPIVGHYDGVNFPEEMKTMRKFDFIYSCFVIQHMSKVNAKKLIQESLNHLAEGGRIFFEFFGYLPDIAGEGKDAFSVITEDDKMYNNAFTKEEVISLVKDLPCKIDFIEEWPLQVKDGKGELIKFDNYWVCLRGNE